MMKIKLLAITFFLLLINNSMAQTLEEFFKKSDRFFQTFVINDNVDYDLLLSNTQQLDEVLNIGAEVDLGNTSLNNYKAFWINSYNLLVIKGILDKYPVKTVQDINGFFTTTYRVAKEYITLKNIEKQKLKLFLKDPFLNFVLVCGANGCPPLIDHAYLPESIDNQLLEQTAKSINNSNFIRIDEDKKMIEVSEIFDWYKEDFVNKEGKIIDFINKFRTNKIDSGYKVAYYKYNWSLNKKR
ncbi:MAG: DUF547 domain-containing protein [Flavobacterium sp.]|nr:DUF547 domain-containing protein [Flavobacterium sp.]